MQQQMFQQNVIHQQKSDETFINQTSTNQTSTEQERMRQMFQRVPQKVQDRLSRSTIGIAGLGGLGSNIAMMLARSGIPRLILVDFDVVEASNLNRQQYFFDQIGKDKTEALKENLLTINPWLSIETRCEKITEDNCRQLFANCDIVCEALDDADCKAILINGILEAYPDKKVVGASGMAGVGDANEIRTERKMKNLYICGDGKSDFQEVEGMLATRVGICAAHQAHMVIRILEEE